MMVLKKALPLVLIMSLLAVGVAQAKVQIRWTGWGNAEQIQEFKAKAAEFNAQHDHIELIAEHAVGNDLQYHEKLLTSMLGGVSPDIMNMGEQWLPRFVEQDLILPLEPFIPQAWIDDVYPQALLDLTTFNGVVYTIVPSHAHLMMTYNKPLFQAAGLPYPTHDWTFSEFLATARKLTKDDNSDGMPNQWGFAWDVWWGPMLAFIWSNGGELFNEDKTEFAINSPEAAEALQLLQDLSYHYHVAPTVDEYGGLGGTNGLWTRGEAAVIIAGPWSLDSWLASGIDLGIVSFPRGDQQEHSATYFPAAVRAVSALTEHPEEAAYVWRWLNGSPEEQIAELGNSITLSSFRSVKYSDQFLSAKRLPRGGYMSAEMMADYVESAAYGRPCPSIANWMEVNEAVIWPQFLEVMLNRKSGVQAVQAIEENGRGWLSP